METRKLKDKQLGAINLILKLGRTLQSECSEIVEEYRGGLFVSEIVKKYDIEGTYEVNHWIAMGAVGIALRGHHNNFGVKSYEGLLEKDEAERLATEHIRAAREKGLGVHAMTTKQRKRIGRDTLRRGIVNIK